MRFGRKPNTHDHDLARLAVVVPLHKLGIQVLKVFVIHLGELIRVALFLDPSP
jgi:hypothetical protein